MKTMFTPEQIRTIHNWVEHETDRVLRKYTRGAVVGFAILALGNIYAIHESNQASTDRKAAGDRARITAVKDSCEQDLRIVLGQKDFLRKVGARSLPTYEASVPTPNCKLRVERIRQAQEVGG